MTATVTATSERSAWRRSTDIAGQLAHSVAAVSVGLYVFALAFRLWAVGLVSFPMTEGSAYYVAVARNLVLGRGLVIDSIWSYNTDPLILPRPAFELWQPIASFIAALPMAINASDFGAAQVGFALFGALVAPLAWLVGRDTARRLDLPERRAWFVAVGAGALAAVSGPFLFAAAVPDSTLPFTVFGVAACLAMPAAVAGSRKGLVGLGVFLGLAYLTRMEAVWIGLAFVASMALNRLGWKSVVTRSAGVIGVVVLVAAPWWLRNLSVFGSPFPGQAIDNVFFTRNENVYSYLEQPTLNGFLGQGVPQITAHIVQGGWHQLFDVLLVGHAPVVLVAAVTLAIAAWARTRTRIVPAHGALAALLLTGIITFVATAVLFPVATLWGTFEHASGPLVVGLIVTALVGGDRFVAWLVVRRHWARQNAWMAPLALIALTVPLCLFQMRSASREAAAEQVRMSAIAAQLPTALAAAGVDAAAPLITDRPIWLADALGRSTLALPDEPATSLIALAQRFGARAVVVLASRGTYPASLSGAACFQEVPSIVDAQIFAIDPACLT